MEVPSESFRARPGCGHEMMIAFKLKRKIREKSLNLGYHPQSSHILSQIELKRLFKDKESSSRQDL